MKIHVRIQDKTYEVRVGDIHARPIQAKVDGETLEVWPEEMMVASNAQPSSPTSAVTHPVKPVEITDPSTQSGQSTQVTAPIPGVITEVKVKVGDSVTYGQELCVLEAMKMKNSIRAGHDGTISKIHITAGEQVQQSKILMEFRSEAA